jgi:hypothetical protein
MGNGEVGLNRPRLAGGGDVQGLLEQCALASMRFKSDLSWLAVLRMS